MATKAPLVLRSWDLYEFLLAKGLTEASLVALVIECERVQGLLAHQHRIYLVPEYQIGA